MARRASLTSRAVKLLPAESIYVLSSSDDSIPWCLLFQVGMSTSYLRIPRYFKLNKPWPMAINQNGCYSTEVVPCFSAPVEQSRKDPHLFATTAFEFLPLYEYVAVQSRLGTTRTF